MRKPNYKSKKIQEEVAKAHAEYSRDNSAIPHFQSICPSALRELAEVCKEGEIRYGEFNWCDLDFDKMVLLKKDAIQHLLNHLNLYHSGDRKENHLAKIMWGCMVMIHYDNMCKHNHTFIPGAKEKEIISE